MTSANEAATDPHVMTDLHTAIALGIDRALRDMGADLKGCTPAMLTGHVIKELREAGLHPAPLPDSETERPDRCLARVPEGNVITEDRQCQQYEGHAHRHTWYGDAGGYSAWVGQPADEGGQK